MDQYEQYRVNPSRSSKNESGPSQNERRGPIRPRESIKDIIYSGVGVGEEGNRAGSRVLFDVFSEIILTLELKVIIIIQEETEVIDFIIIRLDN